MQSGTTRATLVGLIVAALLAVSAWPGQAVELWSSAAGDRYCSLDASVKWTSLLSHAPADTTLYPERWSAASLWRMRLSLKARPTSWLHAEVAYEQRARIVSEDSGAAGGAGILPTEVDAPYRICQLDDAMVEIGSTFSMRQELDRAVAAVSLGRTEVTVGRQGIGWGRGVFFGAADIFAPFTPLESDREWRRGVDAVRARLPVSDLFSVDAVAAIGLSLEKSAFVGRLHGYVGDIDGEAIVGRRREDDFAAVTMSLPVLGAELHGEAAVFSLPEALPGGGSFGCGDMVGKAVVGGSYSLDVAKGLVLLGEYHYSGFGATDIEQLGAHLESPAVLERYVLGDTQILGRHACAFKASYGFGGLVPLSLSWIMSPVDGSGVLNPSASWIFSDSVTLTASAYVPHGAGAEGGELRSEYGGTPVTGLVQLGLYY